MRRIVALQGQKRPPPKPVPFRSTSDGRPSQTSVVTSANWTSSRCQVQGSLTWRPATIRPFGIFAAPAGLSGLRGCDLLRRRQPDQELFVFRP